MTPDRERLTQDAAKWAQVKALRDDIAVNAQVNGFPRMLLNRLLSIIDAEDSRHELADMTDAEFDEMQANQRNDRDQELRLRVRKLLKGDTK